LFDRSIEISKIQEASSKSYSQKAAEASKK